jgi:ferric-dicitrate binding protein FerR (iron transport regulator)
MDDARFYWLINQVNAGNILDEELKELHELMEQDPGLRPVYAMLTAKAAAQSPAEEAEAMEAYMAHYAKMQLSGHFEQKTAATSLTQNQLPERKKIFTLPKRIFQAAAVVLLLAIPVYLLMLKKQSNQELVLVTKKGEKNKVVLADGTKVWLNADSKLSYSKVFTGATRAVTLSGEAYFEVAHDKKHPFIISANGIKVKVLGTAFNLKAYPDDENTETTLIHGLVEVSMDDQPLNRISLKPGEKLKVHNDHKELLKETVNKAQPTILLSKSNVEIEDNKAKESLWTENKLVFDSEPFQSIAVKLGRWYNKEIIINDEDLKQVNLSGTYENYTLEQVLLSLQLAGKFNYRIEKNLVYIQSITSTKN